MILSSDDTIRRIWKLPSRQGFDTSLTTGITAVVHRHLIVPPRHINAPFCHSIASRSARHTHQRQILWTAQMFVRWACQTADRRVRHLVYQPSTRPPGVVISLLIRRCGLSRTFGASRTCRASRPFKPSRTFWASQTIRAFNKKKYTCLLVWNSSRSPTLKNLFCEESGQTKWSGKRLCLAIDITVTVYIHFKRREIRMSGVLYIE